MTARVVSEPPSRVSSRGLSAALSSAILAVTFAAGLPLLWQPPSAIVFALIALCGAALPLLAVRRAAPTWAVAFPVVAAVAALFLFPFHFPQVRIVNVTPARVLVTVDGRAVANVDPTSAESISAGVTVRVPAGQRALVATDPEGRVVDRAGVFVEAGRLHLYAPGSAGVCFWVEATAYGRGRLDGDTVDPLTRSRSFWPLPHAIDYWFAPAPRADGDERSSGGLSYALRQAPCDESPEPMRSRGNF